MDNLTITNYDKDAEKIAQLHATLFPEALFNLVNKFFIPSSTVLDVGCGIGRDSYLLSQQGFNVTGLDASKNMLQIAQKNYPPINFYYDSLPKIATVESNKYQNVLCSAVIMHLAEENINEAVFNLIRVCQPEGIIIISFRGTKSKGFRENGKLYTPVSEIFIIDCFEKNGASCLYKEKTFEEGRGHYWYSLVFKKLKHPEQ